MTRTIKATKDLVASIEDDISDVKAMLNTKLNHTIDSAALIQLLQKENEQLQVLRSIFYRFHQLFLISLV